jgi:hypothetical protein
MGRFYCDDDNVGELILSLHRLDSQRKQALIKELLNKLS